MQGRSRAELFIAILEDLLETHRENRRLERLRRTRRTARRYLEAFPAGRDDSLERLDLKDAGIGSDPRIAG